MELSPSVMKRKRKKGVYQNILDPSTIGVAQSGGLIEGPLLELLITACCDQYFSRKNTFGIVILFFGIQICNI